MAYKSSKDRLAQLIAERDAKAAAQAAAKAAKKKPRGGKRTGAGRKPDYARKFGLTPISAAAMLEHFDCVQVIGELLHSKSHDVRLRTLQYLWDRAHGKPTERSEITAAGLNFPEISVNFVSMSDADLEKHGADLEKQLEQANAKLGYFRKPVLEAEPVPVAPAPDPKPEHPLLSLRNDRPFFEGGEPREPRPALHVVNGQPKRECAKHGAFFPEPKSGRMCPICCAEGEADFARLSSMLPNGPN
jgi:hypothetical protein